MAAANTAEMAARKPNPLLLLFMALSFLCVAFALPLATL